MIEGFLLGILFWLGSAVGGMVLLARLTRGSRRRRLWLILGGMILLPPAWNVGHPTIFAPFWVGVALGLVFNPGKLFQLANILTIVLYFGGGGAVTALILHLVGVRGNSAEPADGEGDTRPKDPPKA